MLLEQEPALTVDLRAGSYHPPTLEALAPYGITRHRDARAGDRRAALADPRPANTPSGSSAGTSGAALADVTPYPYRFHLEQHKLTPIIQRFLAAEPAAEVRFGARFRALDQDADRVRVTFERDGAEETLDAAWLIGCDGGRSDVRHALAACAATEGYTWPERFFVLSTTDDFSRKGYALNAYVADPDEFVVAMFKMQAGRRDLEGLWRLLYPTDPDRPEAEYYAPERIEAWLQRFSPQPAPYALRYNSFYRVHQRVARDFRVGRVLLAGDAAHSNNPLGAFGLNSGIHDAANLIGKLVPVANGMADAGTVDRYARQRRTRRASNTSRRSRCATSARSRSAIRYCGARASKNSSVPRAIPNARAGSCSTRR